MDVYTATGSLAENRTMEKSIQKDDLMLQSIINNLSNLMTAIAALFIKSKSSVGQQTLFYKILLDDLG